MIMPPWDSTISTLGSKDPFEHCSVLVSSATAHPDIIAKAFKPTVYNYVQNGTSLPFMF